MSSFEHGLVTLMYNNILNLKIEMVFKIVIDYYYEKNIILNSYNFLILIF